MGWYQKHKRDLVFQHTNFTCGPAAVRNVCVYLGRNLKPEEELKEDMDTNSKVGTEIHDLEAYLRKNRFSFNRLKEEEDLDDVLSRGCAVLVGYQDYGTKEQIEDEASGHFILVVDEDGEYYNVVDSYSDNKTPNRKIKKKEFLDNWVIRSEDRVYRGYGLVFCK